MIGRCRLCRWENNKKALVKPVRPLLVNENADLFFVLKYQTSQMNAKSRASLIKEILYGD